MAAPPKTVLLVQDQPDLKMFLSNLLISQGYNTIFAENETEGLSKTRHQKPDLIIIDMMMPTEQGIRLYRTLQKHTGLAELPVIMLSSIERRMFFQCHKIQKSQSGHSLPVPGAYIQAPPEADELLRLVKALIAHHRVEKRNALKGDNSAC